MGHSSSHNASNVFLGTLKTLIISVLKIAFLILAFLIGLAGTILSKLSQVIKDIVAK